MTAMDSSLVVRPSWGLTYGLGGGVAIMGGGSRFEKSVGG